MARRCADTELGRRKTSCLIERLHHISCSCMKDGVVDRGGPHGDDFAVVVFDTDLAVIIKEEVFFDRDLFARANKFMRKERLLGDSGSVPAGGSIIEVVLGVKSFAHRDCIKNYHAKAQERKGIQREDLGSAITARGL